MSFSLTETEQNRIDNAALLGYNLDAIGHKDLILITTLSVIYSLNLLSVIFMLYNRHYPPIKSKSPILMAFAQLSCVFWFIGDIQINGHVHLANNTILTNCKGIGIWVRVLLGVCTVSSLIALRSYGLYRVFRQNRPYRGWGLYMPFFVYCVCTLVYGIIAQVLSPSVTVEYIQSLDICYCPTPFRAALYGYIWVTWMFVALVNWKIRNIKSSFNESREMAFSCFVVFVILTFSTALHLSKPTYVFSQKFRILSTAMDHIGTNLVWWAIMGVPLGNCLFNRRRYLDKWAVKLREDGLQNEYDLSDTLCELQRSFESQDDMFFANDRTIMMPGMRGTTVGAVGGGVSRMVSIKKHGGMFAPNRISVRPPSAVFPRRIHQQQQVVEARVGGERLGVDLGDPFDIPPSLPATAVNSPQFEEYLNDPFNIPRKSVQS
ncbi:hypothetical protein LPJ66_006325 [Kickxella alabastrina]|uniref:Uncharacterized protein n=1 Tax=Kickxella alabastrina TaxID=61397 RepID=A0ACC1II41_9FUNG|nr:hypothetical protein LPJ66_006325 [Kickxella alabastrina]